MNASSDPLQDFGWITEFRSPEERSPDSRQPWLYSSVCSLVISTEWWKLLREINEAFAFTFHTHISFLVIWLCIVIYTTSSHTVTHTAVVIREETSWERPKMLLCLCEFIYDQVNPRTEHRLYPGADCDCVYDPQVKYEAERISAWVAKTNTKSCYLNDLFSWQTLPDFSNHMSYPDFIWFNYKAIIFYYITHHHRVWFHLTAS